MNLDSPPNPREELEARLTALLLGELPPEEADALQRTIERDAALSGLYLRLKHAIDLVGEATASQPEQTIVQPPPMKLGRERRQILLAHFKTIAPREFAMPSRRDWSWIAPLGAAAAAVLVLAAIALPNFTRARTTAASNAIINNLRQLDGAKQQWASEERKSATDVPTLSDLKPYMKGESAPSVAGETYRLGPVGESPTAELKRGERVQRFSLLDDARLAAAQKEVSQPGFAGRPVREMATAKPPESIAVNTPPPAQSAPPPAQNTARRTAIVLPGGGEATDASADQLETRAFHADPNKISDALRDLGTLPSVNLAQNTGGVGVGGGVFDGVPNEGGTPGVPQVFVAGDAATEVPGPVTFSASTDLKDQKPTAAGVEELAHSLTNRFITRYPNTTPSPGERAGGVVAPAQPDLNIEPKFADASQKVEQAPTFAWYNKNVAEDKFGFGIQGGTSPLAASLRGFYESNADQLATPPSVATISGREAGKQTSVTGFATVAREPSAIPGAPVLEATSLPKEPEVALALSKESNQAIAQKPGKAPVLGNVPAVGTLFRANGASVDTENKQTFSLALPPEIQPTGKDSSNPREVEHGIRARDELDLALAQSPNGQKSKSTESALILPAISANGAVKQYTWSASQETQRVVEEPKLRAEREFQTGVTQEQLAEKVGRLPSKEIAGPEVSATKQGREAAAKNRAYFEAKRQLDDAQKVRDAVELRIQQESVDTKTPKSSVQITDSAEAQPTKSPTLGQRLAKLVTGKVERTARVTVEKDVSDITPLGFPQSNTAYDPYFIQTESEKIRSRAVLDKVIEKLDLNDAWAKKYGGGKLTTEKTFELLRKSVDVRQGRNTSLIDIGVKSDDPAEAASIANTIAEVYRDERAKLRQAEALAGIEQLKENLDQQDKKVASAREALDRVKPESAIRETDEDRPIRRPAPNAPVPQPEVLTRENAFSTFSLNVSDVSFKLASASLEKGQMPDPASVRSEEFINAFDYRDPEPPPGVPIAFNWERARDPFAQNRDLLRFSIKTAAAGRQPGRPLNLVLLLDNSGSMERADRVQIIHEALRVLAGQLQAQDKISVVTFARTARLWADGLSGDQAGEALEQAGSITPQGGTNLEEALRLAYETALRHYLATGMNRVVLLTDGAANLGNVDPEALRQKVENFRKQGIALDCFGIGWEGYNDDLLEVLSSNGDGRYGFLNSPGEAATRFASQLAGAFKVAASDVKVQVEFNPGRVTAYRQIGYAKHQLTKEQFRDNTVDAAEIGAAEAGNALYTVEVNPQGEGPLATVRVRYRVPGTSDYREQAWDVPFTGSAAALDQSSPMIRLAATAGAFSEWLVASPFAAEVTPDALLGYLGGVPAVYGADERPKKLEWMMRQARSIGGK